MPQVSSIQTNPLSRQPGSEGLAQSIYGTLGRLACRCSQKNDMDFLINRIGSSAPPAVMKSSACRPWSGFTRLLATAVFPPLSSPPSFWIRAAFTPALGAVARASPAVFSIFSVICRVRPPADIKKIVKRRFPDTIRVPSAGVGRGKRP